MESCPLSIVRHCSCVLIGICVHHQICVIFNFLFSHFFLGGTCDGFDAGGRCPRATEYVPDIPDDLQGIFDHTEDLISSVFK